ncbi:MAG: hypothetical protein ACFCUE_07985 [Candidatus Bathyarchaeia archaeon]
MPVFYFYKLRYNRAALPAVNVQSVPVAFVTTNGSAFHGKNKPAPFAPVLAVYSTFAPLKVIINMGACNGKNQWRYPKGGVNRGY